MDWNDFGPWGKRAADWAQDYHQNLRDRPVRPPLEPGKVLNAVPSVPPEEAETVEAIFKDFEDIIVPSMTHWQHPRFFAYFPANAAPISVFAEYLVSSMAAQCMLWQTSPAATELETRCGHLKPAQLRYRVMVTAVYTGFGLFKCPSYKIRRG